MLQTRSKRQQRRKAIILTSFLAFPIILNYFSPYLIIEGASLGIINGSLIVFALMFLSALFLGRLWCGWVCPAGGLQEMAVSINAAPVPGKRIDWIKWAIWVPWMALIVWAAVSAGGFQRVDFFFGTQNGISVAGDAERPIEMAYLVYYLVIALFFLLPLLVGRRAGCHTICWMAPFMIVGRKIRNLVAWPALRLAAAPSACKNCHTCNTHCPMSLDVNAMVQKAAMENDECILCGSCVDGCPTRAIALTFRAGK